MEHSGFIYIYIYAVKNIYEGSGVDQFKYAKKRVMRNTCFWLNTKSSFNYAAKNMLMKWSYQLHCSHKLFKPLESHQQPTSGQVIIFHQPSFPWTKGFPLLNHHHLGVIRSCFRSRANWTSSSSITTQVSEASGGFLPNDLRKSFAPWDMVQLGNSCSLHRRVDGWKLCIRIW